eukprot:Nk52_evm47s2579 gene=Nk52_evmTU47s2579
MSWDLESNTPLLSEKDGKINNKYRTRGADVSSQRKQPGGEEAEQGAEWRKVKSNHEGWLWLPSSHYNRSRCGHTGSSSSYSSSPFCCCCVNGGLWTLLIVGLCVGGLVCGGLVWMQLPNGISTYPGSGGGSSSIVIEGYDVVNGNGDNNNLHYEDRNSGLEDHDDANSSSLSGAADGEVNDTMRDILHDLVAEIPKSKDRNEIERMVDSIWSDIMIHSVDDEKKKREESESARLIEEFIAGMTLEEKVGQMLQLDLLIFLIPGTNTLNETLLESHMRRYKFGAILNPPCILADCTTNVQQYRKIVNKVQQVAMRKDEKESDEAVPGIPVLYGIDSVHGAQYVHGAAIFPHQLGIASTFDRAHSYTMGVIGGKDTRAAGIPWVFSPVLGVASHSLWPRNFETFGEDPFVVTEMGKAVILGYQGNPDGSEMNTTRKVAACMKHFVGYPFPVNGMDRGPVRIPESELMNIYVPSFMAAVKDANAASAMSGFHSLNDEPVGGSKRYLNGLLRSVIGFDGVLVTDFGTIKELTSLHRMVETFEDAVKLSVRRTVDVSMAGTEVDFFDTLVRLVRSNKVEESVVDEGVARILSLKNKVGWNLKRFEQPTWFDEETIVGTEDDWEKALSATRDSIILAKNEHYSFLPLSQQNGQHILFTGPSIHSASWQSGAWTIHWRGALREDEFPRKTTVFDYVYNKSMTDSEFDIKVSFTPGVNPDYRNYSETVEDAIFKAEKADVVVIGIGERPYAEREGNIEEARLDEEQQSFVRKIQNVNKNVVLVVFEGRPRVLDWDVVANAKAILIAFYPGPMGGQAVGEILFGEVNPNGAMPLTYPRASNQIPYRYWHKWSYSSWVESAESSSCTVECFGKPLFEFGHGLSYTNFSISRMTTDKVEYYFEPERRVETKTKKEIDTKIIVSLDVVNTGNRKGKVPVLVFVSDLIRTAASAEHKLLKGFTKIDLDPGEMARVDFHLGREAFEFHTVSNPFGNAIIEEGKFQLSASVGSTATSTTQPDDVTSTSDTTKTKTNLEIVIRLLR